MFLLSMILSEYFYVWRGSDNKFVMNFDDDDWPNARVIHLNKNYQSSLRYCHNSKSFC